MLYEVILDSGETPNKCTIAPQADRRDFRIIPIRGNGPLGPLTASILLHHDGACLSEIRAELGPVSGIAAVDCVWPRLSGLIARIAAPSSRPARLPDGFVTAYPRKTYSRTDPPAGLATIEAIFLAAALLGHWDRTLLERYAFGRQFVELNAARLQALGVAEAGDPSLYPEFVKSPRNSMQRRRDRGKAAFLG
jgi:pre-rRNA-processing protein TSR3